MEGEYPKFSFFFFILQAHAMLFTEQVKAVSHSG